MIKRTLCFVLLLALVAGAVGLGTAPVAAAQAGAAVAPNADLLPADTALYFDIKTGDWDKTVNFVLDTVQKVTGTRPANIYADLDRSLTQAFGRPATFEKDIHSWLGDHVTVAFRVTDQLMADIKAQSPNAMRALQSPEIMAIISVKDDAAANTFITDLTKIPGAQFTTRQDTVGGNAVTIYDQPEPCRPVCFAFAQTKGFLVLGTKTSVDDTLAMLKDKKPTLNSDANFNKVVKALKPDNLMTLVISPRFYSVYLLGIQSTMRSAMPRGLATPQANAEETVKMMQDVFAAIEGQAFGARIDGKVLALDIAQSVNMQALVKTYANFGLSDKVLQNFMLKPIDVKLAEQIPAKALAAVVSSGLPGLYDGLKETMKVSARFNQMFMVPGARNQADFDQIARAIEQFEAYLKLQFNMDVHEDILSWMTGEFALYMLFNPTGTLAKASRSQWPFDHTLLIQTGDAAKTRSFLTKLNAGLEANALIKPESAGDNLFRVTVGSGSSSTEIAYGLVGNTFMLTTGSGLDASIAAAKGDGVLSGSAVWKNAQASMIKPTIQVWFVNVAEISPLVKALATAQGNVRSDTRAALALLDMLESASVSSSPMGADGLSTASMQIVLK